MARGRRSVTSSVMEELRLEGVTHRAHEAVSAARREVEEHLRARALKDLGVAIPAAGHDYLKSAVEIDEDPALLLRSAALLRGGDGNSRQLSAALEERAAAVLALRSDWVSAAMIRHPQELLMRWGDEDPPDGAPVEWRRWRATALQTGERDPAQIRAWLLAEAQASGGGLRRREAFSLRLRDADRERRRLVDANAYPRIAALVSDMLLADQPALACQAAASGHNALGDNGASRSAQAASDAALAAARSLALAYAESGGPAPVDLVHPEQIDAATLAQHGQDRRAGGQAVLAEDRRRVDEGVRLDAPRAAHAALRALEADTQGSLLLDDAHLPQFLAEHGRHITTIQIEPRRITDALEPVLLLRIEGVVAGEARAVWLRVALAPAVALDQEDPDSAVLDRVRSWQDGARRRGLDSLADADVSALAQGRPVTLSGPDPSSSSDAWHRVVDVEPCIHTQARWEVNRPRDAQVLVCDDCGARQLAMVPLHRVPGARISLARQYMARECFYAALEGRTVPAGNLAALRRHDGEAEMDPHAHLPRPFVFPAEGDLASALFG